MSELPLNLNLSLDELSDILAKNLEFHVRIDQSSSCGFTYAHCTPDSVDKIKKFLLSYERLIYDDLSKMFDSYGMYEADRMIKFRMATDDDLQSELDKSKQSLGE